MSPENQSTMIRSRPRQVIGEGSWLHFLSRNHCFTSEAFELGLIERDPNWICWSIEFEHSVRRKGGACQKTKSRCLNG